MLNIKDRFLTLKNKKSILEKDLSVALDKQADLERKKKRTEEAQVIINKASQDTTDNVKDLATEMSSSALSSLFDDVKGVKLDFSTRGKENLTTEAKLCLLDNNKHEIDLKKASGGGIRDIVSYILRCSLMLIQEPKKRKVLILDEPLVFVSEDKQEKAAILLKEICEKLGIQIIMTSNESVYIDSADNLIEVSLGH